MRRRERDTTQKGMQAVRDPLRWIDGVDASDAPTNAERAQRHAEFAAAILRDLTPLERKVGHAAEAGAHATLALYFRDLPDVK